MNKLDKKLADIFLGKKEKADASQSSSISSSNVKPMNPGPPTGIKITSESAAPAAASGGFFKRK